MSDSNDYLGAVEINGEILITVDEVNEKADPDNDADEKKHSHISEDDKLSSEFEKLAHETTFDMNKRYIDEGIGFCEALGLLHSEKLEPNCRKDENPDSELVTTDCIKVKSQSNNSECDENQENDSPITDSVLNQTDDNMRAFVHVIETFEYNPNQMVVTDIGVPRDLDDTPMELIDTEPQLKKLLEILKHLPEISLRYLCYRQKYEPIMCLLMVSTRDVDYIIDAITLKNYLSMLTEIFLNPKILKIVYKAKVTLADFQQILHLFVVNVFDVEMAAGVVLGHTPSSLSALISQHYLIQKKKFRTDCRTRPLSDFTLKNVRTESHYLFQLYHHFKNKLLTDYSDTYTRVLNNCRDLCKVVCPDWKMFSLEGAQQELKSIQDCQSEIFENVYFWKETVAEKKDINPDTVLTKNDVLMFALQMPTDEDHIFRISKSKFVKEHVNKLIGMVKKSKENYKVPKLRLLTPTPKSQRSSDQSQKRKSNGEVDTPSSKQAKPEQSSNAQNGYWVTESITKNPPPTSDNGNSMNSSENPASSTAPLGPNIASRPSPFLQPLNFNSNFAFQNNDFITLCNFIQNAISQTLGSVAPITNYNNVAQSYAPPQPSNTFVTSSKTLTSTDVPSQEIFQGNSPCKPSFTTVGIQTNLLPSCNQCESVRNRQNAARRRNRRTRGTKNDRNRCSRSFSNDSVTSRITSNDRRNGEHWEYFKPNSRRSSPDRDYYVRRTRWQ